MQGIAIRADQRPLRAPDGFSLSKMRERCQNHANP
jgi:hypothetical protein